MNKLKTVSHFAVLFIQLRIAIQMDLCSDEAILDSGQLRSRQLDISPGDCGKKQMKKRPEYDRNENELQLLVDQRSV